MVSPDECIHEMSREQCSFCKSADGPVWQALYPGHCDYCGNGFEAGESIRHASGGLGYEHARHRATV